MKHNAVRWADTEESIPASRNLNNEFKEIIGDAKYQLPLNSNGIKRHGLTFPMPAIPFPGYLRF